MADTIGVKMKVEGESTFSKAMRDAAKNTKALDSELKLAQEQFKASGDAEKLMADRGKILKEQLNEQEKAVKTATDMLQKLASAGYENNSTKVMEWRSKLAQAEQSVLQINNAISNNEQGLDSAGKAYDELGESMQNIGQDAETARANISLIGGGIGWSGLSDSLNSINGAIDNGIRRAAQLAQALWDAGVDATVWADTLLTDSSVYGIDPTTLQQWQYASRFIDTSVESIAKARQKLTQTMTSSSKDTALAFNSLHVATMTTSGELRDYNDVFWDVLDALGQMDNETERDSIAMKLLGRNFAELKPLVEAGREEWEKTAASAPIVSEDKVKDLGEANDAIEEMNSQLETLKLEVLASMAPTIQTVADAISKAATSLKEFLDSDEGQEALTALQSAITGVITEFTEQDFGTVIKDAAGNVADFVKSFAKLLEDKDKIKNALEIIGIGIAGLKLAGAAVNAAKLLSSLRLIAGIKSLGGAKDVVDTATKTVGGTGTVGTLVGKGISNAPILGQIASVVVMGATALGDLTETGRTIRDGGSVGDALQAFGKEVTGWANQVKENAGTFADDWSAVFGNIFGGGSASAESIAPPDPAEVEKFLNAAELMQAIIEGDRSIEALDELDPEWLKTAFPESLMAQALRQNGSAENWAASMEDMFGWEYVRDAEVTMAQELLDAIDKQMQDDGMTVGQNLDQGLANGINANAEAATTAAQNLANSIMSTISSAMLIASPSKVMEQYGEYIGQGLAIGMSGTEALVAGASRDMLNGITLAAPSAGSTRYGAASGDSVPGLLLTALSNMRVEIDGKQAGTIILPTIEDLMAEQVSSRRYE